MFDPRGSNFFTGQRLPAEFPDDVLAFLLRFHASEADAATDVLVVAQNPRRDHLAERRNHQLQVRLGQVTRQVGEVQVRRVLFLLLQRQQNGDVV